MTKNHRRNGVDATLVIALLSAFMSPASAAEPPLGELPAGAIGAFEVRDVGAEVCLRHIFSPETAPAAGLPPGYRLAKLSERATAPWIADLLRERPELKDEAHGSLCFIESGVHTVDGAPVYPGRRSKVAFLWADMVPTAAPPSDPRFLGPMRRVQLFWLYDSDGLDMDLARRVTPNAYFGRITVEWTDGEWRLGIESEDGELSARVRPTSARRRLEYPMPGYETVPLTDGARDYFTVVTFAGHHEQNATGEWRVTGNTGWARTFSGETVDAGSFIQDGFAARVGLYRYEGP